MAIVSGLGDIIRIAGGVVMLGLGVALLASRWRIPRARWLGGVLAGVGLMGATSNFTLDRPMLAAWSLAISGAGMLLACVASLGLLFAEAPRRRAWFWTCVTLVAAAWTGACLRRAGYLTSGSFTPGSFGELSEIVYSLAFAGYGSLGLGVVITWGMQAPEPSEQKPLASLALGVALPPLVIGLGDPLGELTPLIEALSVTPPLLLGCIAIFTWAKRTRGSLRAPAALLALAMPILAALFVFLVNQDVEIGTNGIVRLVSVLILAHAVFRLDALGAGFQASTRRRGAGAATSLAALLIVAQVGQNFVSAQYGLLMGGIVAGALLVAARPIERALEGRGPSRAITVDDERAASYRAALRRYLRDGIVTRDEEVELARLARHLGITHEDTVRMRHAIEDERTGGPR